MQANSVAHTTPSAPATARHLINLQANLHLAGHVHQHTHKINRTASSKQPAQRLLLPCSLGSWQAVRYTFSCLFRIVAMQVLLAGAAHRCAAANSSPHKVHKGPQCCSLMPRPASIPGYTSILEAHTRCTQAAPLPHSHTTVLQAPTHTPFLLSWISAGTSMSPLPFAGK